MLKRILVLGFIAIFVGVTAYILSSGKTPERVAKGQGSLESPQGKITEPLEWSRVLRERQDRESLGSLRGKLLAMSQSEAVAGIEKFLGTGKDRNTGISFEIGEGGRLKGSPTLRVFLLDLLLEIDPAAAARISREILSTPTTADEWAISLRNVGRGEKDDGNKEYLRTKTEELIGNQEWQENPSIGYLNAFDVLVFTGATESSALLSSLIQKKDRSDLAHAGFLTLDRLVQRETTDMLKRLLDDRALQESRPEMTAQQFARADIRNEAQRELVKTWLLDPTRTAVELRNFAGSYPNNNQMISQNLLTSEDRVSGGDLAAHDREVLVLIRGWRKDPVFESLSEYLETIDSRLSQFVNGAENTSR